MTGQAEDAMAVALRRAQVIDRLLARTRLEVTPSRMMRAALEELLHTLRAEGAAVLDALHESPARAVLHRAGAEDEEAVATALTLARDAPPAPRAAASPSGRPVLVAPGTTRFGECVALAFWRAPAAPAWTEAEQALLASVTGIVRMMLEHGAIQREMMRRSRTDPVTLLFNRRAFHEEAARRIERLDQESLPGTLMLADLAGFRAYNARCGLDAGDAALRLVAVLLRDAVRPADLAARLAGARFALFMDGADGFTAAERADLLCRIAPARLAEEALGAPPGLCIGLASRDIDSDQDLDDLLRRATEAMQAAKAASGCGWRAAPPG